MASLLRVKRRREDPSPTDLIVEGLQSASNSPADALASLIITQELPARKRCRFRWLKTSSGSETAENLLEELGRTNTGPPDNGATRPPESSQPVTTRGKYRQVRGTPPAEAPELQVIDVIHESSSTAMLPRSINEDQMMAHYYPVVQQYLQQQKQQSEEKDADDDFVFDYYAMRSSDMDTTMPDVDADLPVIQVREDWLYLDEDNAPSDSSDGEDSNAEGWYCNDYPSSSQSAHSNSSDRDASSDD